MFKVLSKPELSLNQGAIRGWDASHMYRHYLLRCTSAQFDFSLDEPFEELPRKVQKLYLMEVFLKMLILATHQKEEGELKLLDLLKGLLIIF